MTASVDPVAPPVLGCAGLESLHEVNVKAASATHARTRIEYSPSAL
jgi:hypothetical protein